MKTKSCHTRCNPPARCVGRIYSHFASRRPYIPVTLCTAFSRHQTARIRQSFRHFATRLGHECMRSQRVLFHLEQRSNVHWLAMNRTRGSSVNEGRSWGTWESNEKCNEESPLYRCECFKEKIVSVFTDRGEFGMQICTEMFVGSTFSWLLSTNEKLIFQESSTLNHPYSTLRFFTDFSLHLNELNYQALVKPLTLCFNNMKAFEIKPKICTRDVKSGSCEYLSNLKNLLLISKFMKHYTKRSSESAERRSWNFPLCDNSSGGHFIPLLVYIFVWVIVFLY